MLLFMLMWFPCTQGAGSSSVEVLASLLDDLVSTTRPDHVLYGGDLCALATVLTDVVDNAADRLLPTMDIISAQFLSTNISSVSTLHCWSLRINPCINIKVCVLAWLCIQSAILFYQFSPSVCPSVQCQYCVKRMDISLHFLTFRQGLTPP